MVRWPGRVLHVCGLLLFLTIVALLGGRATALAQMELAVIQGTVVDQADGRPLPDVTIRLRDLQRGRETTIKTDRNGRFYRRGIQAVEFEVTVERDGYQPIHDKIDLRAGAEGRFNFKLARAAPEGAEEFAKGVEAYNRGDAAAAAQAFEAALQKAPELAEIRVNLALAYLRLGRKEDAVKQLEQAASMAPADGRVQLQLGGAYLEMQDLDTSAAALEKGLSLAKEPNDPIVYEGTVSLGAVYFARGQNDQAIQQFEKAIAMKPEAPAPRLGLGKAYFSKGDVAKALESFQQLVTIAPGTPEAAEAEAFIKELKKSPESVMH